MAPVDLDRLSAMSIMMVVIDALFALEVKDLSPEAAAGACLLYDQIMSRVEPHLPRDPKMQLVFDLITSTRQTANKYRLTRGLPVRE